MNLFRKFISLSPWVSFLTQRFLFYFITTIFCSRDLCEQELISLSPEHFTHQVSRTEPAVISFTHPLTHPGGCECKPTWFLRWIETRCVLWFETYEPWFCGSPWTIPPTRVKAWDRKRRLSIFPNSHDSLDRPWSFLEFIFISLSMFIIGDWRVLISNGVPC